MDFMKEYEKWLSSPALNEAEQAELKGIQNDAKEIESRFYGPLEFGTAGLRGTMAVGLHNMNIHVIRWATQGFADVIAAEGEAGKKRGVAICMDCRNHSMEFARAAAEVCAANGIHVRIFDELRPTPELSFAVREYHCQAGINVTASHNPKEYNGYKVYWEDGAQLPPHHADAIAKRLGEIDIFNDIKRMDYDEAVKAGLIEDLGAVDLAKKEGADFILGSDPDADRVGIMIRTGDGEFKVITGNQTGVLLLDYLIGAKKRTGTMPEKPVALKTIVTTEMARKVAEVNGLQCYDTFTGFKFLAEKKDKLENAGDGTVIFSYEESYGYMLGDYVRDKDAVTAAQALTEMAAWYAGQGLTLADALAALYEKYGYYAEHTYNLVMPGLDGLKDMAKLMAGLRDNPPAEISGVKVLQFKDYKDGSVVDCATGAKSTMELSGSNVLRFELADGTSAIVRPSGTEPKIKVYILTQGKDAAGAQANLDKYGKWVAALQK